MLMIYYCCYETSEYIERFSEVDPKNQSENNYNNSHSKIGSIMKKVIYMYCKRQAQTFFWEGFNFGDSHWQHWDETLDAWEVCKKTDENDSL